MRTYRNVAGNVWFSRPSLTRDFIFLQLCALHFLILCVCEGKLCGTKNELSSEKDFPAINNCTWDLCLSKVSPS